MSEKQEYDVHPNDWPKGLTPDLERHFERVGEDLVRRDVSEQRYGEQEKYFAALYWLGKKRQERETRSEQTLKIVKWTLIAALLTLVVTLFSTCSSA